MEASTVGKPAEWKTNFMSNTSQPGGPGTSSTPCTAYWLPQNITHMAHDGSSTTGHLGRGSELEELKVAGV